MFNKDVVPAISALCFVALTTLVGGCKHGGTTDSVTETNQAGPRIQSVDYIDIDGNGVDKDDIVLVTFDEVIFVSTTSVSPFVFDSDFDTFGDGAEVSMSVPRSQTLEITLGNLPSFVTGTSQLNIIVGGSSLIRDVDGDPCRPSATDVKLSDFTSTAPTLTRAVYSDADISGTVNVGDTLLCEFDKPISIPSGATVAANFAVTVASDTFGGSPGLTAYRTTATNRGALITLGSSPTLTVTGAYDSGTITAGSPSDVAIPSAGMTIIDTLSSGANTITANTSVDLGLHSSTRYRHGIDGSLFPGNVDGTTGNVRPNAFFSPGGVHHYSGNVVVGSDTFAVDLMFVADTDNNRVLVFEDKPTANNTDASYVLGQPDMYSNLPNRSAATNPDPTAGTLWGPADVHFYAAGNQLIVSDTNNSRLLIWNNVVNSTGDYSSPNGMAADIVLGQSVFTAGDANQGGSLPSSRTLSSPRGVHADGGQLAVADMGNHRVMIWGSIPTASNEAASTVLGQADFLSNSANQGGTVAANTMSSPEDVFVDTDLTVFNQDGIVLVADTGNNRVLVFGTSAPATDASANVALGQATLTASTAATTATGLDSPTGVTAYDGGAGLNGYVWVADRDNHRLMVYNFDPSHASGAGNELQTGHTGVPIGQPTATTGEENRAAAAALPSAASFAFPARVTLTGSSASNLLVADQNNHRVLDFITRVTADASANIVHGQSSFTSSQANGHLMHEPTDVTFTAGQMLVADKVNNRVLIYATTPTSGDPTPTNVVGQDNLNQTLANQGGITAASDTLSAPEGVATDGTRLAVADTGNNRVVVYSTLPTTSGVGLDTYLGQPSDTASLANNGGLSGARMDSPVAVAISGTKLIVCDRDNNRVLIFSDVTSVANGATADVVIGQNSFTVNAPNQGEEDVTASALDTPADVLVVGSALYIVDQGNNRILGFSSIPTSNGALADFVIGQKNFESISPSSAAARLNAPSAVASDGSFFAIADSGNHRIVIHNTVPTTTRAGNYLLGQAGFGATSANRGSSTPSAGTLYTPRGLSTNGLDLWVADEDNSRLIRFR